MTCSVHNVVNEIVLVGSCPSLQTASSILEGSLGFGYIPSDLSDIFFSLNIGHYSVNVSSEEHHFETCLSESFEKRDSRSSLFVTIINNITARSPFGGSNIELFLDFRIIEKLDHSWIISITSWFFFGESGESLEERSIPMFSSFGWLGLVSER